MSVLASYHVTAWLGLSQVIWIAVSIHKQNKLTWDNFEGQLGELFLLLLLQDIRKAINANTVCGVGNGQG